MATLRTVEATRPARQTMFGRQDLPEAEHRVRRPMGAALAPPSLRPSKV